MIDKKSLHLVFLFESGYTHHMLKDIFSNIDLYDPENIWNEILAGTRVEDIPEDRWEKIMGKARGLEIEKIAKLIEEKSIQIVTLYDTEYPEKLRSIGHAPFFLYVRGVLRATRMIGVVGSRKHTNYSERILRKIIPDLIAHDVGIVSGGALGVDSMSHSLALEHSGYTIAVFGTGIDRCYPATNKKLFESILEAGGALISHFPLGTGPEVYNFPMRNEIVAGISEGILIPEAGLSSGTLITAQLALEHGRDVYAVPGDIDRSTSEGSNMLLSTGQAKLVRSAGDILEEYFDLTGLGSGMTPIVKTPPTFSNDEEKLIYESIEGGYTSVDALLNVTGLDMSDLLTHVAMLELSGVIRIDTMGKYEIL